MSASAARCTGPLRRSADNPRYFADAAGSIRFLTGAHTWENLLDMRSPGHPEFDWDAYLDLLVSHGHTFVRLWTWDHPGGAPWSPERSIDISPMPFRRVGPEAARDGRPRFDLTKFDDEYFTRLRHRVEEAGERGLYVSIMLFEGFCLKWATEAADPWTTHPFHRDNNVNGIDGDPDGSGRGGVYRASAGPVLDAQHAYVAHVIDTVNDLDNVLYEVINEIEIDTAAENWHRGIVEFVHAYEAGLTKQHPVGVTAVDGTQDNDELFAGPADWVSPGHGPNKEYLYDPPAADGSKVVIADTDHLWGHGGTYQWVWKSFTRGLNPIFMDPWQPIPGITDATGLPISTVMNRRDYPDWEPVRHAMGDTRRMSDRIDLRRSVPTGALASSGFCLADAGHSYVVYVPDDAQVVLDLTDDPTSMQVEWFDPRRRTSHGGDTVDGGRPVLLLSPFGADAVALLTAQGGATS